MVNVIIMGDHYFCFNVKLPLVLDSDKRRMEGPLLYKTHLIICFKIG